MNQSKDSAAPIKSEATASPDVTLATLVREFRGQRTEVRITRAEYEGRRFTKLHVWESGPHGTFPTRKIITVRDRELGDVIAALESARAAAVDEQRACGDAKNPDDTGARR